MWPWRMASTPPWLTTGAAWPDVSFEEPSTQTAFIAPPMGLQPHASVPAPRSARHPYLTQAGRVAALIRVEAVWLAVEFLDMRAGTETALDRVVAVLGAAHPPHAYPFVYQKTRQPPEGAGA